jgi:hypothetical protein
LKKQSGTSFKIIKNMKNVQLDTIFTYHNEIAIGDVGSPVRVDDFQHLVMMIDAQTSPSFNIMFQGSISDGVPAFGSARSATNLWEYIYVTDLESGSTARGDNGIGFSAADYRLVKFPVVGLKWVNIEIDQYSTGSPTITLLKTNNA